MKHKSLVLAAIISLLSTGASAGIVTYSDRDAFLAASGASGIGALPASAPSSGFSVGDLTFSNEAPDSLNTSVNWSTLISESTDLAINGTENFNVDSAVALFSFGFDFHEPSLTTPPGPVFPDTCNTPVCIDSTFTVSLLDGATLVDSFTFGRPDDILTFVGVVSSDPFNRIEIRETVGGAENEFFGNFLTGGALAVSEPTSLVLLAFGLGGFALRRRR